MKDLIEALTILAKYQKPDTYAPTHCEHDVLYVMQVGENDPTEEERTRLDELGFHWDAGEGDCWASFRFGSA